MSDWLHNLPVLWMALGVFGVTYLIAASIYAGVNGLAVGERARAFKAVSPGILSPMGIVFGLYLAFTAAQVWGDIDRANAAVNREASALSAIVILAASFPGEPEQQTRALVRRYIENTAFQEWPMMARHSTQRINISMSQVNWVKWSCLFVQAICLFLAIAMMHNDNRSNSALALGLFATGGAAAVLLIATHNRPFTGEISVGPGPLLQVLPEEKTS